MATILDRFEVSPSPEKAVEQSLTLTHFDFVWLFFHPVQRLLFFELSSSRDHFLETIVPDLKNSLSVSLSHFLPLAGKILYPLNHGKPISRYKVGDSVSLTVAESSSDFDHLTANFARNADDFYTYAPALPPPVNTSNCVEIPVLALQVTLFPGRGICLGITNHHAIGDASTIVKFIKAWASANKFNGDSKLIEDKYLPLYDRTGVQDPDGLDSIYWNLMKNSRPMKSSPVTLPTNKVRATFIMTKNDIEKLKNLVLNKRPNMTHVTSFTVTCAHAWVSLVKAAAVSGEEVDEDEPEYFCFPADCRTRLNPPLPPSYFGNCLALVKAEAKQRELKGSEGFILAAEAIGEAIQKTVYNKKGILDGAENWPSDFGKLKGKRLSGVAGSPRFDLYDADYGWGRPRKFESVNIDSDGSVALCKSREFEGGLELGLSLPKTKMDAFSAAFMEGIKLL